MSLRMIEIMVPEATQGAIESVVDEHDPQASWSNKLPDGTVRTSVLVTGDQTASLMSELDTRLSDVSDAHVVLMSVEAALPSPSREEPEETDEEEEAIEEPAKEGPHTGVGRLSTAELYQDVFEMSQTTRFYIGLIVLSTIVASMGMIAENTVVIVGAMVIAPLIGPNVGLALSTTLADLKLARESVWASFVGVAGAILVAMVLGYVLPVNPLESSEITSRMAVGLVDIALALAAGGAAVLSLTVGISTALVGVMVAVALLPPLVAAGMLAGAGYPGLGLYSAFLAATNLICINLAGVVTFLVQGVRPNRYWEAEKARRSTAIGLTLWAILLIALVLIVWRVFGITLVTEPPFG